MYHGEPSVQSLTPQEQTALFKAIDDVETGKSNLVAFETTNHVVRVIRHHNKHSSYVKVTLTKLGKPQMY